MIRYFKFGIGVRSVLLLGAVTVLVLSAAAALSRVSGADGADVADVANFTNGSVQFVNGEGDRNGNGYPDQGDLRFTIEEDYKVNRVMVDGVGRDWWDVVVRITVKQLPDGQFTCDTYVRDTSGLKAIGVGEVTGRKPWGDLRDEATVEVFMHIPVSDDPAVRTEARIYFDDSGDGRGKY